MTQLGHWLEVPVNHLEVSVSVSLGYVDGRVTSADLALLVSLPAVAQVSEQHNAYVTLVHGFAPHSLLM